MRLLIVAATPQEVHLSSAFLESNNIPYIITGVGMTATAYKLGKELVNYTPDLVINIGIAGALDRNLRIGDLVQVSSDTFTELGAEDDTQFLSLVDLGFGEITFQESSIDNLDLKLPKLQGITVNTTHGNEGTISNVKNLFPKAATESMEGAAVFYACKQENIPCIQVRCISNYVEKRNRANWDIPLAIKNLNEWLVNFIKTIY